MKAYISVSFSKRKRLDKEILAIRECLSSLGINSLIFVDNYRFAANEEKEMMKQAMEDIDKCDFLIAEVSDKGIGIGIEAGYAKAKGKPVIYLRHVDAEHSTTVSGISDFSIIYSDSGDLKTRLLEVVKNF
ncbi:hypothetical protein WSM22_27070 [Cytophagales bacterium WSM2-2]|nr:hypothetical protein WSM22_27070 [Cytophagales bacterium WSM2-2]